LQTIIADYVKRSGFDIKAAHEVDNLGMAMSLVASTRGVALMPIYAQNFLPWSVISRPLEGETPTIDLVVSYNRANTSATLKLFLARSNELAPTAANKPPGEHPTPEQGGHTLSTAKSADARRTI
jgi:LysR family hca operon transcriptional activator